MDLKQWLPDYHFVFPINVVWGEMDAFQHVNNVVYFRYFESARVEYGRKVRMMDPSENEGVAPILAATSARYKRPVLYPDTLHIGVKIDRLGEDRFWQRYCIVSDTQKAITTEGEAEIVMFNYQLQKKSPIPEALKRRIEALEQREF